MRIDVDGSVHLSEISPSDKPAYLEHLQAREIYEQTAAIPYPYTEKDADEWIATVGEETAREGRPWNWAVREKSGKLIGGIGFRRREGCAASPASPLPSEDEPTVGEARSAEIGYWLAKPFWGRGIMTSAVGRLCEHGFGEMGLTRITAHVFESNPASARVLEKAGFQLECRLRKYQKKDGKLIDVRKYVLARQP